MDQLIELLRAVYPLSDRLEKHLRLKIKRHLFKKGDLIVRAGEVASTILFIESGLIRSFSEINKKRVTNYFMRERDIIISVESFLQQIPANESIEALEDCICWGISFDQLEETYTQFIEFNIHGRLITGMYYCRSEARHRSTHNKKPEEIYEWLMANDPELLTRVRDKHIYGYLETTKQTFSTVKRNFAKRKKH